jgi:excisionase family DNA binding protein
MSTHLSAAIEALIQEEVARRVAAAASTTAAPLTINEFAERSRLARQTVYSLIRRAKLRTVETQTRRVLIPASELTRWLEAEEGAA